MLGFLSHWKKINELAHLANSHGIYKYFDKIPSFRKGALLHRFYSLSRKNKEPSLQDLLHEAGGAYEILYNYLLLRDDIKKNLPSELFPDDNKHNDSAYNFLKQEDIEKILTEENKLKMFSSFDYKPFLKTAFFQIHHATIKDKSYHVYIHRINIEEFYSDFHFFKRLAKNDRFLKNNNTEEILDDFNKYIKSKLDFRFAAAELSELEECYTEIKIPPVDWINTGKNVLMVKVPSYMGQIPPESTETAGKFAVSMFKLFFENGAIFTEIKKDYLKSDNKGTLYLSYIGDNYSIGTETKEVYSLLLRSYISGDYKKLTDFFVLNKDNTNVAAEDKKPINNGIRKIIENKDYSSISDCLNNLDNFLLGFGINLPTDFYLVKHTLVKYEIICKSLNPQFTLKQELAGVLQEWAEKEEIADIFSAKHNKNKKSVMDFADSIKKRNPPGKRSNKDKKFKVINITLWILIALMILKILKMQG